MRLIAGSSGLLGSGFCDVLRGRGEPFIRLDLPWDDPERVAELVAAQWLDAERRAALGPITLVWAAGTGTVGAGDAAMEAETRSLAAVVAVLAERARPDPDNCLLFASSAGAIYGGHGGGLIGEETAPSPITPYGRQKLLQEQAVSRLQAEGVMRTVSCRFTNLYGLTSGRLRRKGLVAALVESALLRQPARIFVNPDTRRDYLFNVDAAALSLAEADTAQLDAREAIIVSSGTTMTVLDVVGSIGRVLRRRVPVVFTESPESVVQPLALRFAPRRGVQATVPTTSFEAGIRLMAEASRG